MRRLFEQPAKVYAVLVPLLVVTWFLAGVGGDDTPSDGGMGYRIGATFWAVFLLTLLFTIIYSVVLGIRRVTRRTN
jgi:hypothetical protein